ncbi:REST corepressor 1-like [Bolinopsis microptera]|uniref:REST corepressor 1-like n=1 Tax=Bolinopsis microptera TaxID=2820187 RepID=UPI00307A7977
MRRPSSGSDESPVHMRIGPEYQASIPPLETTKRVVSRGPALVIWKPYSKLPEQKLMKFVEFSRTKFGYREEQSLGLLVCHRYNIDDANKDLVNFVPYPDDWTPLEKQTFEIGFQEHGKDFHKIKMMLPDKSVNNIVKFYYIWKKTRSKYQTLKNKMKSKRSNMDSDDDSYDDLNEHKNKRIRMGSSSLITSSFTQSQIPIIQALYNTNNGTGVNEPCTNCHRAKAVTLVTLKREHLLCYACSDYYQKYSTMRPLFESAVVGTGETNEKTILNPPEGIDLTLDSLKLVASPKDAHHYLACLTNQVITYKNKILDQKQQYQRLQKKFKNLSLEQYRIPESPPSSSKGWSDHEVEMFKLSFTNYGKDFEAAAVIVGTKSVSQCRSLYYSKKDKYDFDDLLDEYDAKQEKMETDEPKDTKDSKAEEQPSSKDNEIQIVSGNSPRSTNTKSPDNFVFNMQIGGITQPVRLQRVPIQLGQTGNQEPIVIDLTDDDDDSRPAISLSISSEKKETVKKVLHVVNIVDDDIQIIGSNNIK